jgi:hypothetical protein
MHETHNIQNCMYCTNGLSDDEHNMFGTGRRHEEMNENINLKKCAFRCLTLHKCITLQNKLLFYVMSLAFY